MAKAGVEGSIIICEPEFEEIIIPIIGTTPLVINRFSQRVVKSMIELQQKGNTAKSSKKRDPKDFKVLYEEAKYIAHEGWCGIPALAFRKATISACRTVGAIMTRAKLGIFIIPDGFDTIDDTPIVRIWDVDPKPWTTYVKLSTGVSDIRIRPKWSPGWKALLCVRFDKGMITKESVVNLINRVGQQVGVGEGRPDSPKGIGLGYGLFRINTGE